MLGKCSCSSTIALSFGVMLKSRPRANAWGKTLSAWVFGRLLFKNVFQSVRKIKLTFLAHIPQGQTWIYSTHAFIRRLFRHARARRDCRANQIYPEYSRGWGNVLCWDNCIGCVLTCVKHANLAGLMRDSMNTFARYIIFFNYWTKRASTWHECLDEMFASTEMFASSQMSVCAH
jgi:hypothetical protein